MSAMRPLYTTRGLDTTPRGPRHDRRTRWAKRMFTDVIQFNGNFFEALLIAFGLTLLSATAIWGIADILQMVKPLIHL